MQNPFEYVVAVVTVTAVASAIVWVAFDPEIKHDEVEHDED